MEKAKPLRIIFITLVAIDSINDRNIYADLMRYFFKQGHHITIVSPVERRYRKSTSLKKEDGCNIMRVKTLNIQKTNVIEKGISTFLVDYQLKSAIKKNLSNVKYDLAIYSTPPITLVNTIEYLKDKFNVKTYLLLKDIFPQNAVDLKLIKKGSFLYKYFRNKEKQLYKLSDRIGCMSQANVDYVRSHNQHLEEGKVEISPNSIEINDYIEDLNEVSHTRRALGISDDKCVFIYGGNLGKPQGVDFLIKVLETQVENTKAFFIIIGSGTEYNKLENWYNLKKPANILLKSFLPKKEYDKIVRASDIGMIFLDYKFTFPNYPSRLLAYLQCKKPVLAFTDESSDIGKNAEKRNYGKWSPSNDVNSAKRVIDTFCNLPENEIKQMGNSGYSFLKSNYTVKDTHHIIMKSLS